MRSIGKKNIALVKRITKEALKRHAYKYVNIEECVVGNLPLSMWSTWESADSEIRRIINDTIMEAR